MVVAILAATTMMTGCAQGGFTSGEVLFQDDFSRASSGWDRFEGPGSSAAYLEGAYQISVEAPSSLAWGTPRFNLADVRLEVDSFAVDGPLDNAFGLICRYEDPDNFLFFFVSSDGYSGIGALRDGVRTLITGKAMLPSEAIVQGHSANHLRADCIGSQLTFAVNSVVVNQAQVEDRTSGDVGVIVGTYAEPGAKIRFDNFAVIQP